MPLPAALAASALAAFAFAPAALAAPGQQGSLPSVASGERPGPELLYRKPATAPQLRHRKPFRRKPLLVSGTDAYRGGEYLYQDYLYDDYGANTVPGRGTHTPGADDVASQTDGDIFYPSADEYADNAADLVELRVKRRKRAIFYRVTLNTLKRKDTTMVGIGIDTDRDPGGAEVPWPAGAGITSPGVDLFVRAWGTGGLVSTRDRGAWSDRGLPGRAVKTDLRRNQITIRVGRRLTGKVGKATWRHFAGVGLHDGDGGFLAVPARSQPTQTTPASGTPAEDAPAIFNLAFRWKEPQRSLDEVFPEYDSIPAAGVWFEAEQSRRLAAGSTGDFHADIDFRRLAKKHYLKPHRASPRTRARILSSRLRLGEGVEPGTFPKYRGRLQPYLITVPPSYRENDRDRVPLNKVDPGKIPGDLDRTGSVPLTFTLHSLGGNHAQYLTYSPNQLRQFGIQRENIVVSPLARGTDGWYTDEAEVDVFEVWADVAFRYKLDPERTYPSGYSMGGYGTYKLGVQYPDLWARAFTTVGPPGEGIWVPPAPPSGGAETNTNPLLENVRWIPYMNWAEVTDQLVPYTGVRAQHERFDRLGLRNQLWSFTPGEHFTLAILDQWGPARDFLGNAKRVRDPSRVDYGFFPDADRPGLGLVHDHAYWVSDLVARNLSGDPASDPARGFISARSLAFGEGDPPAEPLTPGTVPGLNGLNTIEGTEWGPIPPAPKRNALEVEVENLASGRIDGTRARLDPASELTVSVESDGRGTLLVALPGLGGTVNGPGALTAGGLEVRYGPGDTEVTVTP